MTDAEQPGQLARAILPTQPSQNYSSGTLLAGISMLLLLAMAAATSSTVFHGIAFVLFQPVNFAVVVLALVSITKIARVPQDIGGWRANGARAVFAAGLAILAAVGTPILGVWALGEQTSAFAYLVALAFAPAGLVIAAHIIVIGALSSRRAAIRPLLVAALVGLVGSLGSPGLTVVWLRSELPSIAGPIALALGALAVIADVIGSDRARKAGPRRDWLTGADG